MIWCRLIALWTLLAVSFTCRQPYSADERPDAAVPPPDGSSTLPRDDLVPMLGTPEDLDLATWNIENFPQSPLAEELAASIILSLGLDLVAVQEIADEDAFDELMAFLPAYEAVLSSHTYGNGNYQKVGFIYRADLLQAGPSDLLFEGETYAFPRPPLAVPFTVRDPQTDQVLMDFTAIVVHLKAGIDASDRERRRNALTELAGYLADVQSGPGDRDVLLLGDFNESFDSADARSVWAPLLSAPETYDIHTTELDAGSFSLIPYTSLVDHIVTTTTLSDDWLSETEIPRLDQQINTYVGSVSDHLPVITSLSNVWQPARRGP